MSTRAERRHPDLHIVHKIEACSVCGADGDKRCLHCEKPFCDAHLFEPANSLISKLYSCGPCAKNANEIMFVDEVGRALAILFGIGLAGVTIHSPNGVDCRYNSADVAAGIPSKSLETIKSNDLGCIVRRIDGTGELYIEGIVTQELLVKLAAEDVVHLQTPRNRFRHV